MNLYQQKTFLILKQLFKVIIAGYSVRILYPFIKCMKLRNLKKLKIRADMLLRMKFPGVELLSSLPPRHFA